MRRFSLYTLACAGVLASALGCVSGPNGAITNVPLLSVEQSLIFWPSHYPAGDWSLDPGVEDVWLTTEDGTRINGWYAECKDPRAVVLYAHGNGGSIADLRPILRVFHDQLRCSLLLFDYRGYGRSSGSPSEQGLYEDARTARAWLANRAGIALNDVVLAGHSLGGAVMVDLAANAKVIPRGLILESVFTSLPETAANHLPTSELLMQMQFDSLSKIPNYRGPLLQTHGDSDDVIPFFLGRKLFKAANEPKQFVPIHGGGHNDPPAPDYVEALDHFLGTLSPVSHPGGK
jgi:fermentation-respiration switch protein FrsA (DUF1100 family)